MIDQVYLAIALNENSELKQPSISEVIWTTFRMNNFEIKAAS